MFTDLVGYVSLMGLDVAGSVSTLGIFREFRILFLTAPLSLVPY